MHRWHLKHMGSEAHDTEHTGSDHSTGKKDASRCRNYRGVLDTVRADMGRRPGTQKHRLIREKGREMKEEQGFRRAERC